MRYITMAALILSLAMPAPLWACACGCGVFDVGTSSMFPTREGSMLSLEYDYQNQNRNWSGTSPSSADNNNDKQILTNFVTVGYQHLFNRKWGFMAELPYWFRAFKTTDNNGDVVKFDHSAVGDIRLRGLYTGFSDDMSTGLNFGFKLPTGDYTYPNFDPDTEIGTGSTDLLLGGYHLGRVQALASWAWFINGEWNEPVIHQEAYHPGRQADAALGAYYDGWRIGGVKVAPLAQVIETYRWRDGGTFGHSMDSGYERVLLAPGVEFEVADISIYTDVGFPVVQNVNGNQLVASELYKLNVSYHF